jgi:hypothetical protein
LPLGGCGTDKRKPAKIGWHDQIAARRNPLSIRRFSQTAVEKSKNFPKMRLSPARFRIFTC